jgi:hypothetical protein
MKLGAPGFPSPEIITIQGHPSGRAVPVSPAASEVFIGYVAREMKIFTGSFTRPADAVAYTLGDVVFNATSSPTYLRFDPARVLTAPYLLNRISYMQPVSASTMLTNLWIFNTDSPIPSASGDNATALAWATAAAVNLTTDLVGMVSMGATNSTVSRSLVQQTDTNLSILCTKRYLTVIPNAPAITMGSGVTFDFRLEIEQL